MKRYITFLFIGPFLLMMFIAQVSAQTHWTKYTVNPVLNEGPAGSWDDYGVSWPFVIYDGAQFVMWYTGKPDIGYGNGQIGRAISPDGIDWRKYEENPVLPLGPEGEWDDFRIDPGPVIFDESGYRMWYTGYDGSIWRIGLATSQDGIDWTKYEGNPVLNEGPAGSWDDEGVAVSTVLFEESIYKMWYVGYDGAHFRVGYTTSPDGMDWTKYEENHVLDVGSSGSFDAKSIEHAYVILNGDIYQMWYQGRDEVDYIRTGYATSPDGIDWTKYEENPVLDVGSSGSWDTRTAKVGSVILQDNVYRMWYMARTVDERIERIGYATAPVTINVPDQVETIQAAIDSAVDGNLVLVDEGTYYENINFKGKAITVASHFYVDGDTSHISNTIIDGSQHEHPDSGSVVYFVSGEDTNSVLCGFTITGGSGTKGIYNNNDTWDGGGIYCASGGRIINNIVRNNVVHSDNSLATAGGIEAGWDGNEYVIIENNTISSNTVYGTAAGSGGIGFYCSGRIINNTVVDNAITAFLGGAMGGGIQCYGDIFVSVDVLDNHIENNQVSATASGNIAVYSGGLHFARANGNISNNVIKNNSIKSTNDAYGGGIFINASQTTKVANNLISFNRIEGSGINVTGGGILYASQYVTGYSHIYNNIMVHNESKNGNGGGLSLWGDGNDEAVVFNNTVIENKASYGGGGIYINENISVKMFNSILWGNQASNNAQIYSEAGSSFKILYSDIQGGFSGEGNIDQDPLFEDTVSFRLSESSPCIGAGIDSIEISGTWFYCPDQCYYCMPRPMLLLYAQTKPR